MNNNDTIKKLRGILATTIGEWEEDGSVPPIHQRLNGLGVRHCVVDVRCGGYQDCWNPVTVGWEARVGNVSESGVVIVDLTEKIDERMEATPTGKAINEAKRLADKALEELTKIKK